MTPAALAIPPARRDRHLVFVLLAAAQLVFVVQFGMVSVGLQDLTNDLHAPLQIGRAHV